MVVNRLQDGLINSRIAPGASGWTVKVFFFKWHYILFFGGSDRDFNSENNNVSQV
jgi:hypothetical protein